jgi:hypothetical protein
MERATCVTDSEVPHADNADVVRPRLCKVVALRISENTDRRVQTNYEYEEWCLLGCYAVWLL